MQLKIFLFIKLLTYFAMYVKSTNYLIITKTLTEIIKKKINYPNGFLSH